MPPAELSGGRGVSETVAETVNWSDQRNALRQRTLKRGRALVNGIEVAAVTVRNMSLTGARLVSPDCANLPDAFTLTVGDEGLTREVEVRSRSGTGMGVRFLKPLSTRELGAEFLQAKSNEAREQTVAEKRADLLAELWHPEGSVQLGAFPRVSGRENVKAFFARFLGNPMLESLKHEMIEVWEMPDASIYTAIAIYDLADGSQLRVPYTNIVRYRDDLFHDYRVFVDTAPLVAAFERIAADGR